MTKIVSFILSATMALTAILAGAYSTNSLVIPEGWFTPAPEVTEQVTTVDDSWFDDSIFIGHSLIEAFSMYSGLDDVRHYSKVGATVDELMSYSGFSLPSGGTGSLSTALGQESCSRVYVMMGINEIGNGTSSFINDFDRLVDTVRAKLPNATVYVLAVTPTTRNKSNSSVFNRSNIMAFNEALVNYCTENNYVYVDLFDCFADAEGYLPSSSSSDGIHLNANQYPIMLEYLKTHAALPNS